MKNKQINYSLDESIGYWLYRSQSRVSAALRQTFQDAGYDLTPEQWSVLYRLQEQEGMNQIELSEKTHKDRHNITRILKQLDKRGYIEKRNDKNDRRAHLIYLTEKGRSFYENIQPLVVKHRERISRGINANDLFHLRQCLERITHNMSHQQQSRCKQHKKSN
jgi:DNA-binding MarR family transcriptional regulator